MVRILAQTMTVAVIALSPAFGLAQTPAKPGATQGAMGQGGAQGQQMNQPSPNQNQPQMQTSNSQQPGQVKVLPPTSAAQTQPDPKPELSK